MRSAEKINASNVDLNESMNACDEIEHIVTITEIQGVKTFDLWYCSACGDRFIVQ